MNLGIGLGLTNYLRVPTVALDPDAAIAALFSSGEEGAWYDPSDSTTVFQDAAGTTPAGVGDPVGLILDKSKGGVSATNQMPATSASDWTVFGSNTATDDGDGSVLVTYVDTPDAAVLILNNHYAGIKNASLSHVVSFEAKANSTPVSVVFNGSTNGGALNVSATTYQQFSFTVRWNGASANMSLQTNMSAGESINIKNIRIYEAPGNHATQTTSAARPILQQSGATAVLGSELVTNGTFDTDTSGWTTTGSWVSNQLEIGGGEQATQQVTLGSGTFRLTWDQTITAGTRTRVRLRNSANSADVGPFNYYTGSESFSVDVTTSSGLTVIFITEAADTALLDNISVKQITSWSGGLRYLDFDGVDDSMAVTFAAAQAQPNSIGVGFKFDAYASKQYDFVYDSPAALGTGARHTLLDDANTLYASAGTPVSVGSSDLADHVVTTHYNTTSSTVRLDGSVANTGDFGSRQWGGVVLGAGFSQAAGFGLDGRIYSYVGVNRTLTAGEISDLESYLATKSGVTL